GDLELLETELKNYISQNNQVIKQEIEPTISVVLDEILLSSKNKNNEIKIIDFLEKLIQDSRSYSSYLLKKHNINLNKIQEIQNHKN
ncbi:ATP-dependent Clp protease ATP-binding subunit ClpA, partial [Escherichia coli]|nr:ATP-dependent Clp protease ATP-binding subunit ClpA [Escherichia coli]